MMNEHAISAKSAVSMLKWHELELWNYTSSEDEEEAEEEEGAEEDEAAGGKQERRDSSDEEGDEKRIKLGPDPSVSERLGVDA